MSLGGRRKGMDRPLWDCNRKGGKGDQMGSGYLFHQLLKKLQQKNEKD